MFAQRVAELVLVLLLVGSLVDAQDLPIRINITTVSGDGSNMCPPNDQLEEARNATDSNVLEHIRLIQIRSTCNCGGPGWTQVANFDMTDPNQQCPSGFRLVTYPQRSCGRISIGCVSTAIPVHGVEYSRVCGRVIGYQDGTPDAFRPYYSNRNLIIDNGYVDGVVLTHGSSPRNHIWTFAAALDEVASFQNTYCPCTRPDLPYTGVVPPFIGEDYFCETGSRDAFQNIFYPDDPLWDGQGCGAVSTCCNHPLYFCKQLPQPTTDDIEFRLCGNQASTNEDTPIERVEIYVQ